MEEKIKIGITIGDRYGIPTFKTDITDPFKSLEEANDYLHNKYKDNIELMLVNNHKKRRRRS